MASFDLAAILAPVTPAQFFAEHYDKAPLHVPGSPAKFASVMGWRELNRILDQTHIWSGASLKLAVEGQLIPQDQYCQRAQGRDGVEVWQPLATRVQEAIRKGASLVLNDIDSLTPGLSSISNALEAAGLGKAQANLYLSWQSHRAFQSHFDTHDVWAVHVEGEKTWNVYEGRFDAPIPAPAFRQLGQAFHDKAKRGLMRQVRLKPGDLLYLPRGWYHDALADSPSSIHVAFGVNAPLALDFLNLLQERAMTDSVFRQSLPRWEDTTQGRFALQERAVLLGQKLAELCRDPKVLAALEQLVSNYRFPRGGYGLGPSFREGGAAPVAPGNGAEEGQVFRVFAEGAKTVRRGADWALKGAQASINLTPAEAEATGWVLSRTDLAEGELRAAFPLVDAASLLQRLSTAGIVARA